MQTEEAAVFRSLGRKHRSQHLHILQSDTENRSGFRSTPVTDCISSHDRKHAGVPSCDSDRWDLHLELFSARFFCSLEQEFWSHRSTIPKHDLDAFPRRRTGTRSWKHESRAALQHDLQT